MTSRLQQELRQTRPFRSTAAEATVGLLRTADHIRRDIEAVLAGRGVTFQQYNVLRILRGAGEDGLPTLDIAERMIERAPGITRLLDRLEAKQLVRRQRCPTDRRQVMCWLTSAGSQLLARLDEPIAQADEARMSALSAARQKQLITLLDRLRGE